jgi:UPF0755 protein
MQFALDLGRLPAWRVVALVALAGCLGQPRPNAVWVDIPADAPVSAVAESLAAHGIVTSAAEFESYAQVRHRYMDIMPGVYPMRPNMSMGRVLSVLRKGRPPVAKVIVRERMTIAEVALELKRGLGIRPALFLQAAQDYDLRARVGARAGTLEGYLYPTMYYVNRKATAEDVVRQMVDTFQARWNPEWDGRLDSLGATRDEIVTLASIIAGEMPLPEDIFQVASVYHNRLARGMRLQADPTVVYALGERRRLNYNDYRVASEYNTYTRHGLPPGPIGQPSVTSLEAALYPVDSDYLFFVGRRDGRHEFSRSYREHLRTIAQVRGRRRPAS